MSTICGNPAAKKNTLNTTTTPKTTTETASPQKTATEKRGTTVAKKVDVNTATRIELEKLPAIGSVNATKIIEGRPYKAVADVEKAIGASRFGRIKNWITVGENK